MTPEVLEKLLIVARRWGVQDLQIDNFKVSFGALPSNTERKVLIGDEGLAPTEDQLLFWSTGLAPEHEAGPPDAA